MLTTQHLDEADQLADNIIVIDHGRVVASDTPSGLKSSIGTAFLQLTLKNADDTAEAAQIVERVLGAKVQPAEASELIAPMDNTDKLTDVLTALKDAGIILSGVNVRQPTLDEVFFALTGETVEDKKNNDKEEN